MFLEYLPIFKVLHLTFAFIWISFLLLSFFVYCYWVKIGVIIGMIGNILCGICNAYVFGWGILQNWFYNKMLGILIIICISIHSIFFPKQNITYLIILTYLTIFIILHQVILK